jgi:hypothetical protein
MNHAISAGRKGMQHFAVDRRPGKEETYFALPGLGILQIGSDLKTINMLDTPDEMRKVNLHDTTVWYDSEGSPYLTFPANDAGKIFTTTLEGKLVRTLDAPTAAVDFEPPDVGETLISTTMPKEDLGLKNFKHVHNAALRKIGDKFYIIAQAWNPGDFAILEQVTD